MTETLGASAKPVTVGILDVSRRIEKNDRRQMTKFLGGDLAGFVAIVFNFNCLRPSVA